MLELSAGCPGPVPPYRFFPIRLTELIAELESDHALQEQQAAQTDGGDDGGSEDGRAQEG